MNSYMDKLLNISKVIKSIGGDGSIHGCIVDIDYYNHIYIILQLTPHSEAPHLSPLTSYPSPLTSYLLPFTFLANSSGCISAGYSLNGSKKPQPERNSLHP